MSHSVRHHSRCSKEQCNTSLATEGKAGSGPHAATLSGLAREYSHAENESPVESIHHESIAQLRFVKISVRLLSSPGCKRKKDFSPTLRDRIHGPASP